MTAQVLIFAGIFLPFVLLVAIGRIKLSRKLAQTSVEGYVEPPFASEPLAQPRLLPRLVFRMLPGLSAPQRAYLVEQLKPVRSLFFCGTYAVTLFATQGLLPDQISRYVLEQPPALRIWYSFLSSWTTAGAILGLLALAAAVIGWAGLGGTGGSMYRTRPVSLSFLFWARMIPGTINLVLSMAAGLGLSFALLLLFHGPVWRHLNDDAGPRVVNLAMPAPSASARSIRSIRSAPAVHLVMPPPKVPKVVQPNDHSVALGTAPAGSKPFPFVLNTQARHFLRLLATSAPTLALSIVTSTVLLFTFVFALLMQPFFSLQSKRILLFVVPAGIFGVEIARFGLGSGFPRVGRVLFLYVSIGPPPPLIFVSVPILLSIGCLLLAKLFFARSEL